MIRLAVRAALVASAVLVLAGCGGGSSSTPQGGGTSGSATTSSGSTPGGTVQGVQLTDPGTALRVGQAAKVSWRPGGHPAGVVQLQVSKLEKAPIAAFRAWQLDAATKRSTPYYVHVKVDNLGHTNLSGVRVPLYLLDDRNTLLQASTFKAQFPACPSTPLPARFKHGKKASVCLVYFVPKHGTMTAVSFRPEPSFAPITWAGPVSKARVKGQRQGKG